MVRSRETKIKGAVLPRNWAELLFELGQRVRKEIRGGAGIEETSRRLDSTPDNCRLAFAFATSNKLLQLRAMVEDWPWEQIVGALGEGQQAIAGPQKAPSQPR